LTTAILGGNLTTEEFLLELFSGAVSAGFEPSADSTLVSEASAAEAQVGKASDTLADPELGHLGNVALATRTMQIVFNASGLRVDIEGAFAQAVIDGAATSVPELKGRARYDSAQTANGNTSPKGKVTIGPRGLASVGWLQSTLRHESVHVDQIPKRWYWKTKLGQAINEFEAYEAEQASFDRFGLSTSERNVIENRLWELRFEIYKKGGIDALYRLHQGDYTLP
jgi:hypothetical protein